MDQTKLSKFTACETVRSRSFCLIPDSKWHVGIVEWYVTV